MSVQATKVQPTAPATTTEEKAERKRKPNFDLATAVNAAGKKIELDEDGALMAIPVNWSDRFMGLKKGDFTEPAMHYEWKAIVLASHIKTLQERIEELNLKATEERVGLTPTEKAVRKREALLKQLEKLDALIAEDGVEAA